MKKLLFSAVLLIIGVTAAFANEEKSVTYSVGEQYGDLTIEGDEPAGSEAEFEKNFITDNKMVKDNYCILTLKNYDGYNIKRLILQMSSISNGGAGTFSFMCGNDIIASIDKASKEWYNVVFGDGTQYTKYKNINVQFNENYKDGFVVEKDKNIVITIKATESALYIKSYTIIYEKPSDLVVAPKITLTNGDLFYRKQQINISCDEEVNTIYFTTDGTKPTISSQEYDKDVPVYIDETTTIKAIAKKDGKLSNVATKTFTKEPLKAIVAKYKDNFYGMTKTKRNSTDNHLLAQTCSVYNNSLVLCNPENLMDFAWLIKDDKIIQDYKSLNYLSSLDKDKTDIKLDDNINTTWYVSDIDIKADNNRYLCYSNNYFGVYVSKTENDPAYPFDLVKGYTRNDLSPNKFGTICLSYDVLNDDRRGATFYNIAGKKTDKDGNVISLILEEETGTLVAGRPYIFEATDNALCCIYLDYADDSNAAEAGSYNGLYGSFSDVKVGEGNYIIKNNKINIVKSVDDCWIAANRAYIIMEDVPNFSDVQQSSKRILSISIDDETTNISDATIDNQNNTMIYNLHGQRVASPSKGLYIVNGKKTIINKH